jgi:hypothetical protein
MYSVLFMLLSKTGYNLIIGLVVVFFAMPVFAGNIPSFESRQKNPITITWDTADFSEFACSPNYWGLEFAGAGTPDLGFIGIPLVSGINTTTVNLPVGTEIAEIKIYGNEFASQPSVCDLSTQPCLDNFYVNSCNISPSIYGSYSIISGGVALPAGLPADIAGIVGGQFADTGTLAIVGLSAGLPLAFYFIRFIITLL